ncbi:CoA transferase [Nonomuraea sp. NPDC049480]|uniref:CoA transferase n=1 Tax=Nonomuraea sp. NPDC049480 TaxID=3364353 RepID=UPI0037AB61F6
MTLPLQGLRIVEISSYVATPLGGMTLAQLGADVIRVEPIGGAADRTRWPLAGSGTSLYWSGLNKGKRAIEVDLSSGEGCRLVAGLIAGGGGIVITNADRYPELTFEALRERRPDVIHVLLTGRRDGGAAVDYTVQAATGFPLLTGPENVAGPVNTVVPAWDVAAGLYLAAGLLAAERHRLLTGEGQRVRLALEDVALATAGNLGYLAEAQLGASSGTPRERDGNHVYGTFGRDFATADGERLMIVALTARHWRDLLAATGLTDVVSALAAALGADFAEESERYRHRKVLAALLAGWFESHTRAEAETALRATRVLWSAYRSFTDLAAGLPGNPLMAEIDQPGVGRHWAPGSPLVVDGEQPPPAAAPQVGRHTDDVLRTELGLSEEDLATLRKNGVIHGPTSSPPEGT